MRQWHPVRLALVCAILAMAGGSAGARGDYAEVSAPSVAVHAGTRAQAMRSTPVVVTVAAPSRAAVRVTPPVTPRFAVASLYLTHCSLLL